MTTDLANIEPTPALRVKGTALSVRTMLIQADHWQILRREPRLLMHEDNHGNMGPLGIVRDVARANSGPEETWTIEHLNPMTASATFDYLITWERRY